MALPACFHLADDVFPRVRAESARRLVGGGMSQSHVAAILHVSQAMISKYAARPPATDPLVIRLADELMDTLHAPAGGPSAWCSTLSIHPDSPGADAALADLLQAEQALLHAAPLALMPEVGLNLARSLPDATSAADVLAYPARIVAAGERIVRPVPPALGASNHLAACLLALRVHDPSLTAIANVRGGADIAAAAGATQRLDGSGDRTRLFVAAVATQAHRIVHDPGAVGIEPCLYIAGVSAMDVVQQIVSLAKKVQP